MRTVVLWVLGLALVGLEMLWLAAPEGDTCSHAPAPAPSEPPAPPPTLAPHPSGRAAARRDVTPADYGRGAVPGSAALDVASGGVEDAVGRPAGGAGVYALDGSRVVAEAATDAGGRFIVRVSGDGHLRADRIAAVARGTLAAVVTLDPDYRLDLRIRLIPDPTHGRLELSLVTGDGSPAAGAHVWIAPEGSTLLPTALLALSTPLADDPLVLTRRLRARLEGAADLADQEYEVGQGCGGISALHPDAAGRVQVPALLPGRYRVVAATRITSEGRELPPDETLMISAYCTDGNTSGAQECSDALVDVAPPPAASAHRLVLRRARAIEGRVVVDRNPAWGAQEQHWRHRVEVDGCWWSRAEVESGSWGFAGTTHAYSGRFRLEGLPRTACRILVATVGPGWPPVAHYNLPAVADGAREDASVRDIHVADRRLLSGAVAWSDGSPLTLPAELVIAGYAGTVPEARVEIAPPGSSRSGAHYYAPLDRPLVGSEFAVVRIGIDPTQEYRIPLAAYDPDHPETLHQDLVIPAPPPPPGDNSAKQTK